LRIPFFRRIIFPVSRPQDAPTLQIQRLRRLFRAHAPFQRASPFESLPSSERKCRGIPMKVKRHAEKYSMRAGGAPAQKCRWSVDYRRADMGMDSGLPDFRGAKGF
jgi:hypothetical protein